MLNSIVRPRGACRALSICQAFLLAVFKRAKFYLTLPLALFSGWGLSLAAVVNFVVIGYVLYADNGNLFGLESGDAVTIVGSYDDSALINGTGTISFGAGSGNTFKIVAGDRTYTQSDDIDYQTGGYTAMTVSNGSVQGVEFLASNSDWERFDSQSGFFGGDDGYFGTISGVWGTGDTFNGILPGEFSVSPTGAAIYSIPIDVPAGIGGMQPQLSLDYNSQGGNGLLGMGWSLGGLSGIARCPATLAQDNFLDPVDFDSNDRLCLDG